MNVSAFNIPQVQVGNRVMTDVKNLIVVRGGCGSGGNLYGTARQLNASAGYQVPVGKTFRVLAVRTLQTTLSQGINTGYGDTDVGKNSGSAPTNSVWASGDKDIIGMINSSQYGEYSWPTNFTIPAGKYPACYVTTGGAAWFEMWGYLE